METLGTWFPECIGALLTLRQVISGLAPTSIDNFAANAEGNSPASAPIVAKTKSPGTTYVGPTPGPSYVRLISISELDG